MHKTTNNKYNLFSIIFFLAWFVLLSGCTQNNISTLNFGLSSQPVTLDPRFATDAASTRINRLIYQRLVDFNDQYKPIPAAASWEKISDLQYRFTLKPNLDKFSNGESFTVKDVLQTYLSILDQATASPHRGSLKVIEKIDVINDTQLDFYLKHADPLFPGRLVIGILPASILASGKTLARTPVGNGVYELQSWAEGGKLILKRRSDDQLLSFIRVQDPTVRVLKLIRGEIDMLQGDIPPELIFWLGKQENIRIQAGSGSNFTYLGFNMEDETTSRLKVRQAIAHAIDRQAIIKYVLNEHASIANALLTPEHWAGNSQLKSVAYDQDKARHLLKEAGFASGQIKLEYKTSSDPFRIRLATVIQQQLSEVGIQVKISSYDWGTFYGDIKAGRFQMYSLSWVGIKMPDIFRYVFSTESIPPKGANRGRYRNIIIDELIDKAESSTDLKLQAAIYRQIQKILLEELPYIPLWYEDQVFVSRDNISDYSIARDGNYDGLKTVQKQVVK